jgi:transcriptional regulator with XRE-family HTH domain
MKGEAMTTSRFGVFVRDRRGEIRLTLRAFAERAAIDPGNLSKMERGRESPPQDEAVLDRICRALELEEPAARELKDIALVENGRIPSDILENEELMARMPVLLRTVNNQPLTDEQLAALVKAIRDA